MPSFDLTKQCSIGVVIRDRLSLVSRCLSGLAEQGLDRLHTVAVIGAASAEARKEWSARFPWVEFVFMDEMLMPGRARNVVLDRLTTPTVALLDADVLGRPDWLLRCEERRQRSRAAAVVPLILEAPDRIHAAGNLEYVNREDGGDHLHKELRFHGMPYGDGCVLAASEVDYGETHCLVCEVDALREVGGFQEAMMEFVEVDLGRRLRRSGRSIWFEPDAVVEFWQDAPIEIEDVPTFVWRWDRHGMTESCGAFSEAWGIDISEQGRFDDFVSWYNAKLGPLPRRHPSVLTLAVDRGVHEGTRAVRTLVSHTKHTIRPVTGSG